MPLINCEVNLILAWSSICVITNSTGGGRFAITDTKLYVSIATLSTRNISHNLLRTSQYLEKFMGIVHFAVINQAPSSYSMLTRIGRVATPNLVPRTCLRYWQTRLIIREEGLVSEFM